MFAGSEQQQQSLHFAHNTYSILERDTHTLTRCETIGEVHVQLAWDGNFVGRELDRGKFIVLFLTFGKQ